MAFGGVATGNIKAQDAATAINALSITVGISKLSAMAAKTGTNKAALAVLLANSVRKTTKVTMASITRISGAPCKKLPI